MKASISKEFEDAIHDYIILGLLVETLEHKQRNGENVEQILDQVMKGHIKVKKFMRKNGIKVHDGEKVNEDFYEFWYTVKVRGGYKEGNNRYWRPAIRRHMNKRLESLRKGESILTREYEVNGH